MNKDAIEKNIIVKTMPALSMKRPMHGIGHSWVYCVLLLVPNPILNGCYNNQPANRQFGSQRFFIFIKQRKIKVFRLFISQYL